MSIQESYPRGSEWRRWDPHVHAPGTALNDQFEGTDKLDAYVSALEAVSPPIQVVGITDYLSTKCYVAVLEAKAQNRLPAVKMIFPNIELRLSIGTSRGKGVNFHLLASPEDPNHVQEIERFLARLTFQYHGDKFHCTEGDLRALGCAYNSTLIDEEAAYREGVNQFKVDFNQLREELDQSDWMRRNVITAVAAGSNDGTSGLQDNTSAFAAQRQEIEAFADIVFSGSERQVAFWLGEGALDLDALTQKYRGPKPCLHGSDAHSLDRVGSPDLDRRTWIKGDPIFESLRQACLEPETRVFIGSTVPELQSPERTIGRITTPGASWLLGEGIEINPGLVAVIGARGSGKTALADLLAHGTGSSLPINSADSFLSRAGALVRNALVSVEWSAGDSTMKALTEPPEDDNADVHYLSQQFVERLCSAESANDELLDEINKVVFAAHNPATRLGATSFADLVSIKSGDSRQKRHYLVDRLDSIADDVQTERGKRLSLPSKLTALETLDAKIAEIQKARSQIVRPGSSERAGYYERLRQEIHHREGLIQTQARVSTELDHLESEVQRYQDQVFPNALSQLQRTHRLVPFTDTEWKAFIPVFSGNVTSAITDAKARVKREIASLNQSSGVSLSPELGEEVLKACTLESLRAAFAQVEKEIGVDQSNARRLQSLNERLATEEMKRSQLREQIRDDEGSDARLTSLFELRDSCYREFFDLIVDEERILTKLYSPLEAKLSAAGNSVGRLRLRVVRTVDLDAWATRGEQLIDLRKSGTFKGHGALATFAREQLVPAWEAGTADEVSAAMSAFRTAYDAAIQAQAGVERGSPDYQQWVRDVGRWLYSTDHIRVTYSFEYDGIPLIHLSPGTRGIVLLLLYLALDLEDHRPLIIDQPEENLDPKSVYSELVTLFRNARSRRQVIIITHNANLVVNTDVDQVIVASCGRGTQGQPLTFSYRSGGLENAEIRAEVCEILEGGETAFRQRARRLRVTDY